MLVPISIIGLSADRLTLTLRAYPLGATPADAAIYNLWRDGGWTDEDLASFPLIGA
jgi:hypothetical protein